MSQIPDARDIDQPLRVLLVEDAEDDAQLLVRALQRGGFAPHYRRVETDTDFRAALVEESWDIVIADYILPHFSGIAAIRIARETGIDLPIIMVSGKMGEETAVEAMRASAQDFLLKGNLARLVPAIQRELQDAQIRRERRQTKEALQQERNRAQQYLDVAGVMMLALDQDGRVTLINPKGLDILGCTEGDVIGKDWFSHYVPIRLREDIRGVFRQLMAGQIAPVEYYENPIICCTGEERLVAFHNSILRDEHDQIVGTLSSGEDITERRQAEEKSHLLFEALEAAANSVVITDRDGIIVWINPAFTRMTGYNREEAIGQNPRILNSGKQPRAFYDVMWATICNGKAWQGQLVNRRKNGTLYTEEMTITPVRASGDDITHYVAIKEDITKRKLVEAERERLHTEVQRRLIELDTIFNAIVDPMIAYNADGIVIQANPAMVKTVGRDPAGMSEAAVAQLLAMRHPDGTLMHDMEIPATRALRGEAVTGEQLLVTDVDGHVMILQVTASPLIQDGKPWGAVSIWHDISQREHLFHEVQRRVAELDATINAVADGLIIFNPAGEILVDNPAVRRLLDGILIEVEFGKTAPQWLSLYAYTPDGKQLTLDNAPGARAARGETVMGELLVFRHQDSAETWASVTAAPIRQRDDSIIGVVSTYTDITALHELQEQQKVLLHLVSHDLRAPLTIIKGHIQVLEELIAQAGVNGLITQGLKAVERGVARMNAMIQDLVDAARAEGRQLELQREAVDLRSYLPELLRRSAVVMEVARIQVELPDDLPPVSADYNRLERIFTNLLSNALKFSDPGTPVLIRARCTDDEVEVAVIDQGHGISPDDLPHLFDRFYRTKGTKAEGVGLGLYITRQLVEAHGLPSAAGTAKVGGRVWVESEVGKGSTFMFTLPVASRKTAI